MRQYLKKHGRTDTYTADNKSGARQKNMNRHDSNWASPSASRRSQKNTFPLLQPLNKCRCIGGVTS